MLIDKNSILAINDIVTVKLVSGEEIVGKLIEQTADHVSLAKPVTCALQPVSSQQMGLSFIPVLGSVDPDVSLQIPFAAMAIRPARTGKSVCSKYIQMTTGLITAGASAL